MDCARGPPGGPPGGPPPPPPGGGAPPPPSPPPGASFFSPIAAIKLLYSSSISFVCVPPPYYVAKHTRDFVSSQHIGATTQTRQGHGLSWVCRQTTTNNQSVEELKTSRTRETYGCLGFLWNGSVCWLPLLTLRAVPNAMTLSRTKRFATVGSLRPVSVDGAMSRGYGRTASPQL
eukprot:COSAG02_NODE_919_length_15936_cov_5.055314_22_plen_175_part_00